MLTIWKYTIPIYGYYFVISLPKKAKVLTVQVQHGAIVMWVLVDPDAEVHNREFLTIETGTPITVYDVKNLDYIGTVQLEDGNCILHLFEIIEG